MRSKETISFLKNNSVKASLRSKIKLIINTINNNFPSVYDRHTIILQEYFLNTTINLLINSSCRDINRILSGKVLYDGYDEMKKAAQVYFNKHCIKINKC